MGAICNVYFERNPGDENEPIEIAKANANLIAAAPDLLNALDALATAADSLGIPCDAARAAIAKARGES